MFGGVAGEEFGSEAVEGAFLGGDGGEEEEEGEEGGKGEHGRGWGVVFGFGVEVAEGISRGG